MREKKEGRDVLARTAQVTVQPAVVAKSKERREKTRDGSD